MSHHRSRRGLALSLVLALTAAMFAAGPGHAAKRKRFSCSPVTVTQPEGHSSNAPDAVKLPIVPITPAATEASPVTVELEYGPSLHDPVFGTAIQEGAHYFNFQIVSKAPRSGIHIRQEWAGPASDFDLYMYQASGEEVATSNSTPFTALSGTSETGGPGYESIPGFPAASCSTYTIESKAFISPGETVTLKVWLGEVTDDWHAPPETLKS